MINSAHGMLLQVSAYYYAYNIIIILFLVTSNSAYYCRLQLSLNDIDIGGSACHTQCLLIIKPTAQPYIP